MLKTTKLDMDAVRASVQKENSDLVKQGYPLPYLENGEIKFVQATEPTKATEAKQVA